MRFLTALIFTFLVTPAFAKTTVGTSLVTIPPGDRVLCGLVSNASKPIDFLVSLTDSSGNVLNSGTVNVQPGTGLALPTGSTPSLDGDQVYCSFEFSGGSAKSIRGSISVLNGTNDTTVIILPAF